MTSPPPRCTGPFRLPTVIPTTTSTIPGQAAKLIASRFKARALRCTIQAWGFTQEDNFCRLDLDKSAHSLQIRVFDRDGQPVRVTNEDGRLVLANQLSLATWE